MRDPPSFCSESDVEDDRHRAVVYERDLHSRSEHTRLHRDAEVTECLNEVFVEGLGYVRRCRAREVRSSSLRTFAVGDERELADHERFASNVEQREVEAPFRILEDAEARDPPGEPIGIVLAVAGRDPEKDDQAIATQGDDVAVDRHRGTTYSLHDCTHSEILAAVKEAG